MKKVFSLYFFLLSVTFFGQNQPWRSFYSYNDVVDLAQSPSRVFSAGSTALFEKNLGTNELKTITSVDGVKVETITAIMHSPTFNRTVIGNQNGLIIIINGDGSILNRIGIVQESTIAATKKRVNNIYEYNGKAYIGCDFGISVLDLATLEFNDTYYLGPNGSEISVLQTAILNGTIYAACGNNGIRLAALSNPNLNDFSNWSLGIGGNWSGVVAFAGSLFAASDNGLYRFTDQQQTFVMMPSAIVDVSEANGFLVVTSAKRVTVYNEQLVQTAQINVIPLPEAEDAIFSCATVVAQTLFVGTVDNGTFSAGFNSLNFENITPNGPSRSNIFSIKKATGALWAVYGDYSSVYNPYPLEYYGVSKFTDKGWSTIPNDKLFNAASISDIVVSPTNENLVYVSSFHEGLIKIENDEPIAQYTYQPVIQNGPESLVDPEVPSAKSVRINSLAFDKTGNLWMTNARIEKAIKSLKAGGGWSSYNVKDVLTEPFENDYGKMAIDKNGTKWIPSTYGGVIAFNESGNPQFKVIGEGDKGNLPTSNTKCVAIDNNNRLWIGTAKGLRVLQGIDRFNTEINLTTNAIIILEDGLAQELMYEQSIIDIAVDGGNNKWIGTGGAGAFLVSPDGQQTLFHFTKENSPLPSNTINDIEIDNATGEVFFATDKGMVSYRGTSTEASDDLSKVYVFPNPVRPTFEGNVNISGLLDKANVKITDIEGNLVYETTTEGGTVLWDTRAFGKYKVASGVYMIFISSEDGTKTKVKKVMIIR